MSIQSVFRIFVSACLLGLLLGARPATVAHAAAITVNSTADVIADDGQCTLREAVTAANTDAASGAAPGECAAGSGADTISLPAGTYTLALAGQNENANATGDLDFVSNITLSGAGAAMTIIQAGITTTAGIDRVIHLVSTLTTASFENLTIRHGYLPSGSGAGIYVDLSTAAAITLTNTAFSGNSANLGHALRIEGSNKTVTIAGSTFSNNGISTASGIGTIHNGGILTMIDSRFEGNRADTGGAVYVAGGPVTFDRVAFINNDSSAVRAALGVIHIRNSLFANNVASRGGTPSGGGAIAANGQTLDIVNTTFSGNLVTVASGDGGAINNRGSNAKTYLTGVTFYGNGVPTGGEGGTFYTEGVASLKNSLLTASVNGDCGGTGAFTGSGNLIDDTTCGSAPAFRLGAVTNLAPALADNGGPTLTHALLTGSNAIDAVTDCTINAASLDLFPYDAGRPVFKDQRGFVRGDGANRGGAACDVGASEAGTNETNARPIAAAGPDQSVTAGHLATLYGGSSYDLEGGLAAYGWTQIGGAPVTLSSTSAVSPTFSAPSGNQSLMFSLVVTDTGGLVSVGDAVTITVSGYRLYLPLVIR